MAKTTTPPPRPLDRSGLPFAGRQLVLLGLLGAITSAYGMYVEQQKHQLRDAYTPLCDSEYFSCSKVMMSEYGRLLQFHGIVPNGSWLDVPNTMLGVGAYSLFILYPLLRKVPYHQHFYVLASMFALGLSVYLAYVLSSVLRDFCLVCVTAYVINIGLFWYSLQLLNGDNATHAAIKKTKLQ